MGSSRTSPTGFPRTGPAHGGGTHVPGPGTGRAPTAGIVATGSELLAGRVHDANGPWIAERLGELGIEVAHILLVGDRPDDMESALRYLAGAGVDLVVTSGGLGPTADDLTAAVVADVTGRPLELDEHMEKVVGDIIARFADRLRWDADALAEANRKQAMVPRGATPIQPVGTAPGLAVPPGDGYAPTVLVLPGPPREVQGMWDDALTAEPMRALLERTLPFDETHLRLFGVPESEIAATLRAVGEHTDLTPLEIVTCLRDFTLEVDLRRRPDDDGGAGRARRRRRRDRGPSRPGRVLPHGRDDRRAGLRAAGGPDDRDRRVVHRWAARRSAHRARPAPPRTCRAASSPTRTRPRNTCSACPTR